MNVDKLKNYINLKAKNENLPHQVLYDAYFFEHFLSWLSESKHKNSFVLKGGFLLGNYVGLESRSTYDIDLSYKQTYLSKEKIGEVITDILSVDLDDNINYRMVKINDIMTGKGHPGLSIVIEAKLENLKKMFHVDIATSDVITPAPVKREYISLFGDLQICYSIIQQRNNSSRKT